MLTARSAAPLAALGLSALVALGLAQPARSAVTTYAASDFDAGPGATHPNSDASAAVFDSAASLLGTETKITFESTPVGAIPAAGLGVAPGVTLSGHDFSADGTQTLPLMIEDTPSFPAGPDLAGFNITPGGANYLNMNGGTATFTFATPIQAFGAYLTGVQTNFYQDTFTFDDGTSETLDVPGNQGDTPSNGDLSFVGFTDPGKAISAVSINASDTPVGFFDEIGVDDVRFVPAPSVAPPPVPAPAVPEATSVALCTLGALPLLAVMLRTRRNRA